MKTSHKTYIAFNLFFVCALLALSVQAQESDDVSMTTEYVRQGSAYYLKHDFKRAIPPYEQALKREKVKRQLDQTIWTVLVVNLGMSYGITGDLQKAKETFEYGISKDPDYPLFYYNMACTYGEMDEMDKAIEYLKLAFERKDKMIAGERFPNPATDSSFKRFLNNEKFQLALKDLNKNE